MDLVFYITALLIVGIMIYGYYSINEENPRRGH